MNQRMNQIGRRTGWTSLVTMLLMAAAPAVAATSPVLAVIDPAPKAEFEGNKQKLIRSYLEACKGCELRNITPYNANGQFDPNRVPEQLDQVRGGPAVVLALWNRKEEDGDQALFEKMKAMGAKGVLFVATAGRPGGGKPLVPLSKTLWGQSPDVVIIGELNERERLPLGTYFGPEMLTAIRTPADFVGQDMAALIFSTRLLARVNTRTAPQWMDYLKNKKATSRKMWPTLDEFFGN